jgi:hypothetical protein
VAQDLTSLFNLALSAIGQRELVSHPDENSPVAETCRLWYETVRDHVLKSAPWPSAKGVARLAVGMQKAETEWLPGDPDPGFLYAYNLPNDFLHPQYLAGYQRFILGMRDATTPALMTNTENALLVYTRRQVHVSMWDASLFLAMSQALASYICLPLNGKPQRARMVLDQSNQTIMAARQAAANTDFQLLDSVPEWLQARGYVGNAPVERFIYPYAPLLAVDTF